MRREIRTSAEKGLLRCGDGDGATLTFDRKATRLKGFQLL